MFKLLFCLLFLTTTFKELNSESPFARKMFETDQSKKVPTNKFTTGQSDKEENKHTESKQENKDVYTNNLETFTKRVTNFILNECEKHINNKQSCLLLREFNIPTSYYRDLKDVSTSDIPLRHKLVKIHELFDLLQNAEVLNLESSNLSISKEKEGYLYLKSLGTSMPMLLLLSYFLFCILVAYAVMNATINRLSILSVMFCLFLFTFLVSVPYEYLRLYQEAIAERNAKLNKRIPDGCLGGGPSLWDTFLAQFSFHDDQCLEWHLAYTSSPLLMVSPAKAFSVAFTKFFTGPLVEIAGSFSKSFSALLIGVPVQWQLPLILVSLFLFLVLLCIGCGYSFNFTPFISFKPSRVQRYDTLQDLSQANLNATPARIGTGTEEKTGASPIKLELTINTHSTPVINPEIRSRRALVFNQSDLVSEESVASEAQELVLEPDTMAPLTDTLKPLPDTSGTDKENRGVSSTPTKSIPDGPKLDTLAPSADTMKPPLDTLTPLPDTSGTDKENRGVSSTPAKSFPDGPKLDTLAPSADTMKPPLDTLTPLPDTSGTDKENKGVNLTPTKSIPDGNRKALEPKDPGENTKY